MASRTLRSDVTRAEIAGNPESERSAGGAQDARVAEDANDSVSAESRSRFDGDGDERGADDLSFDAGTARTATESGSRARSTARPRFTTQRVIPILVILGLVFLGVLFRFTIFAPDPIEVRTDLVRRGLVEATVTNSKAGTVEARLRSRIASETGGRVVEIAHREGARVEKGMPLIRLNDVSQVAQRELAIQGVAVAKTRLEDQCLRRDRAKRELGRTQRLAEKNVASEDRLDALQYAYDSARVACDGARAEKAQADAQLLAATAEVEKTVITAPFTGIVAEVNVELGEWVTPSPPLLTSPSVIDLIDPKSIYVSAPMDEVDTGAIRVGLPVKLTIDSRPGEKFPGKISRVAPYVVDLEAQNRTLEIEVELDDAEVAMTLLPGTSADVEVVLEALTDVLRVPTSALIQNSRVLLLEGGKLVEREVELGLRNWQYAEVRSGLTGGEEIVVILDRLEIAPGVRARARDTGRQGAGSS